MYAAICGLENVVLKALDNQKASIQQNNSGMNIGMYAAYSGLEEATLKALNNKTASAQTCDNFGLYNEEKIGHSVDKFNIGMFAALKGLKKATKKAWNDPVAREREGSIDYDGIDSEDCTIKTLAAKNGIKLDKIKDDSSDLTC